MITLETDLKTTILKRNLGLLKQLNLTQTLITSKNKSYYLGLNIDALIKNYYDEIFDLKLINLISMNLQKLSILFGISSLFVLEYGLASRAQINSEGKTTFSSSLTNVQSLFAEDLNEIENSKILKEISIHRTSRLPAIDRNNINQELLLPSYISSNGTIHSVNINSQTDNYLRSTWKDKTLKFTLNSNSDKKRIFTESILSKKATELISKEHNKLSLIQKINNQENKSTLNSYHNFKIGDLGKSIKSLNQSNKNVDNLFIAQNYLDPDDNKISIERVKLTYFRNSCAVKKILDAIKPSNDALKNLNFIGNCPSEDASKKFGIGDDEVIIWGLAEERRSARRLIAILDLPRPGIELQMWGIRISSDKPKQLAKVMNLVSQEINKSQQLFREAYGFIQNYAQKLEEKDFEPKFKSIIEEIGYKTALSSNRGLSPSDILLRLVAAEQPSNNVTKDLAIALTKYMVNDDRHRFDDYINIVRKAKREPFERFFSYRGLKLNCTNKNFDNKEVNSFRKDSRNILTCDWTENGNKADIYAQLRRKEVLNFGFNYAYYVNQKNQFNSYYLQQYSDELNNSLQNTEQALNKDIEDLFMLPTLIKIQKIVRKFGDVEYAEVGRTTLAGLDGLPMSAETETVSAYDYTSPLSIKDLLSDANDISKNAGAVIPTLLNSAIGKIPINNLVGLIGALEKDRTIWRQAKATNGFTISPNVLRNMTSAELNIVLRTTDPLSESSQQGVTNPSSTNTLNNPLRPISRISTQTINTTVYVKAMDLFAFSTFSNQSTIDGGRGYFPLIGPVWRGLFGDIPFFGKLFSWERRPKSVLHESLLLTNSYITPTSMGIAILYPENDKNNYFVTNFGTLLNKVENYPN